MRRHPGARQTAVAAVLRRHRDARRATEAQLRLLQGRIEPHFLFNTLANVLGLMAADPPRARQMLATFVDYRHVAGTRRDDLSRLFVCVQGHSAELPVSRAYMHLSRAM